MDFFLSVFYFLICVILFYELLVIGNYKEVANLERILDNKSNEMTVPATLLGITSFYIVVNTIYSVVLIAGLITSISNYCYIIILLSLIKRVILSTSWGFKHYDQIVLIDSVLTASLLFAALDYRFELFDFNFFSVEDNIIETYQEDI